MKTLRTTTSDGVQTLYDAAFDLGYFERGHVYVYAGEDHSLYETQLDYIWQNDTQLELTNSEQYPAGTLINVRRVCPRTDLYVKFKNSTGITQLALNNGNRQALMLIEEQDDGFKPEGHYEKQDLDFENKYTVTNLRDGIEDGDAVTMRQIYDEDFSELGKILTDCEDQAEIATEAADEIKAILEAGGGLGGLLWTTTIPIEAKVSVGYACDTTLGSVAILLPATPATGTPLGVLDLKGTAEDNPIIVQRNGNTIMGLAEDMTLSENNGAVVLVFLNGDWRIISVTPQGRVVPADSYTLTHITLTFDAAAIAAGADILVGYGSDTLNVQSTQVEVITPFDGGAEITIGTVATPDVLLTSAYVDLAVAGAYGKTNNYDYSGLPEFKLFPSGTPTVGEARVTIYFN